jgi:alanyl-tRNA synthetase
MKKLIVTVADLAVTHGAKEPLAYKLVPVIADIMRQPYPELIGKVYEIEDAVKRVEEAYLKVKSERVPELKQKIQKDKKLPREQMIKSVGEAVFLYRDTYGLTIHVITDILTETGINEKDREEILKIFEGKAEEQKNRSRAFSKMTGDVFSDSNVKLNVPKTKFVGYEHSSAEGEVLKLFIGAKEVREVHQGDQFSVILNQTPFYAESGGQVGDTGTLWASKIRIKVNDTHKHSDIFIHSAELEEGRVRIGDKLSAQIDEDRRLAIMRNHTATHILQAVLREILGPHVKQQGSLVAESHMRFDFTHPKAIGADELKMIEDKVNKYIISCHEVTKEVMSLEKAKNQGALAFFAEKYGDTVRVVSIGPFSKEFCGGTHLNITGQIGPFKVVNESAVAQGIRRIEAVTGPTALHYIYEHESQLNKIAELLKTPTQDVVGRVELQAKQIKKLEKELEAAQFSVIQETIGKILEASPSVKETKLVTHVFQNVTMETLRKVSDLVKQKVKSAVIVVAGKESEDAHLLIAVTDDLVERGIKAGDLIKEIAPLMGGSGGGRPQLAQAGSKNPGKVADAIEQAKKIIKDKIQS